MPKQTTPMNFNPTNGLRFIEKQMPEKWRMYWPERQWQFNPWTGKERQPEDVQADPLGRFVAEPAKEAA